jgi:hypothetical protein
MGVIRVRGRRGVVLHRRLSATDMNILLAAHNVIFIVAS